MAEEKAKKVTKKSTKAPEAEVKAESHSAKATRDDNTYAVIETGGKQYGVTEGDTVKIEKILGDFKVGDKVNFDKILLVGDKVGTPYVVGAKVSGSIKEIGRNQKVTVIKYKQKSRYFKKNGHRQPFFKVEIDSIV